MSDKKDVTFKIIRDSRSRGSYKDKTLRQLDIIVFTNNVTGKTFTLYNSQTVVSNFKKDGNPKTDFTNTIRSNEDFTLQYLGNSPSSSRYKGPVFNVQNANTDGLGMINENGVDELDSIDLRPYRLHSNYDKNSNTILPMASDGCPMYPYEQIKDFEDFLNESNIKPGDVIKGRIEENVYYGP